jgi:acetyl esterase/lipase
MALDARAKRFLDKLAALNPPGVLSLSAQQRRVGLAHLLSFAGPSEAVATVTDLLLPGPAGALTVRLYVPAGVAAAEASPGLLYFHGGGMVAGSIETHDRIATALADATGCRLISVDYRLAPEHPFPAAIEDAIAATEFVAANAASLGIDAERLVIGGDSAGGTLAAVVCQYAQSSAGLSIAAQCLICPVLDFEEISPSREAFADDRLIGRATLEADLADYLPGGTDAADVRVSPLRALNVKGLPTAIIHTAEFDPMRDEGNAYARKLLAAGVNVEHVCHDGMIHNFHAMGAVLPQARLVLSQIGEQVRRAVSKR